MSNHLIDADSSNLERKRVVFLSETAVPHQVKLCEALQSYVRATFMFYEGPERTRGTWWAPDLGDHCEVLENVPIGRGGSLSGRYVALGLRRRLAADDPDLVVIGGLSIPSNYVAYRWARRRGLPVAVFTERSRSRQGKLRRRGLVWRLLRRMYKDLDLVIVSASDAVSQFRDEFGFGDRVVVGRYAADIDKYLLHPQREPTSGLVYIFANRLIDIYGPDIAVDAFATVLGRYPDSRLVLNAVGELRSDIETRIDAAGIAEKCEFLDDLRTWDDLDSVYRRCDVLVLPARFSNGNFTILEAMASGMGVVVSENVLGNGPLIDEGVNGFRCEATSESLAEKMIRYAARPELINEHATLNRPIVRPLGIAGTAEELVDVVSAALCAD